MGLFAKTMMLALASAGAPCSGEPDVNGPPRRSTELPRPRDGNVAVQEELDAARRAGTVEAYDLFIARYPRHPLAQVARRERGALTDPAPKPRR
jgi:hypothetical protein